MKKKKIIYLVTEDWYFFSHRLPMAKAALDLGFEVIAAVRTDKHKEAIEKEGIRVIPLNMDRTGKNPVKELKSVFELIKIYKEEKPDIVHNVAMKPVLYGSFAALIAKVPAVINAMAGMGFLFIDGGFKKKAIRSVIVNIFKFLLNRKNCRLIVQNDDDFALFKDNRIVSEKRIIKIAGSGVSTEKFTPLPEPEGKITATVTARMLWDKGIGELVEAAEILKERNKDYRIILVGDPDSANPKSIPENTLEKWQRKANIEWWGHSSDIINIWKSSHIAVLPSYREGLPKSLLEAAACQRPMIATDVAGCHELVKDGHNGLLVPVKNAEAIADAIEKLAEDKKLRNRLGKQARKDIEDKYSEHIVAQQVSSLYKEISE